MVAVNLVELKAWVHSDLFDPVLCGNSPYLLGIYHARS